MSINQIKICEATRKALRISLLWPSELGELKPTAEYKLKIFTFVLLTGILTCGMTINLCLTIIKHPDVRITEEVAQVIAVYGSHYMICAYLKQRENITLLLRDLSNFEKFGEPPHFKEENKKLNIGMAIIFSYTTAAVITYGLMKVGEKGECKKNAEQQGLARKSCGTIAHMWLPFEIDYFPVFHVFATYEIYSAFLIMKMSSIISYQVFEIGHHIVLRLNHLKIMILDCFEHKNYKVCREKLTKCILYHSEILDMAQKLEKSYSNSMFAHLFLTGSICACLEKQIMDNVNEFLGAIHILAWILALFLGCTAGQHLLNANTIIPEALWNSKWFNVDVRLQKDVLFIMQRCQREMNLRAGPFGILCYPLFVSILKMSYSIFCWLSS